MTDFFTTLVRMKGFFLLLLFHAIAQSSGVFVLPLSPSPPGAGACAVTLHIEQPDTGLALEPGIWKVHNILKSARCTVQRTEQVTAQREEHGALSVWKPLSQKPHGAASGNPISCWSRALHARPGSHLAGGWTCCPLGLSDVWCPALGTRRLAAPDWGKVTTCFLLIPERATRSCHFRVITISVDITKVNHAEGKSLY